jgi:hypothetical protein
MEFEHLNPDALAPTPGGHLLAPGTGGRPPVHSGRLARDQVGKLFGLWQMLSPKTGRGANLGKDLAAAEALVEVDVIAVFLPKHSKGQPAAGSP